MNSVALLIASVALVLAAVAYWRSGGQYDVALFRQEFRRDLEHMRTIQKQLTENAARSMSEAYQRSQARLTGIAEHLEHLKDEAGEGLESRLQAAGRELQALRDRVAQNAKAAKNSTLSAAYGAHQALARAIRRLEARTSLLSAKSKVQRAVRRAKHEEFELAERRLEEAMELVRAARETLGDDRGYDRELDKVKNALRGATSAIRAKAEDSKRQIEHVLSETDSLVARFESERTDEGDGEASRNGAKQETPSL